MTNKDLGDYLANRDEGEQFAGEVEDSVRLFVFEIDEKYYAVEPSRVREINMGSEIYPLPFCPAYVSGLINVHGEPYTVIDLKVLIDNQKQEPQMFLILTVSDDHVALAVTEVVEICEIPEGSITVFDESEEQTKLFAGSFLYNDKTVLWVKSSLLLEKLAYDL